MQLNSALSFCEIQNQFVFLDTKRDRYFSLNTDLAPAWRSLVKGDICPKIASAFIELGIVLEGAGAPIRCCSPCIAEVSLLDVGDGPCSLARSAALAWTLDRTQRRLRKSGLATALAQFSYAKQRGKAQHSKSEEQTIPVLGSIARDFARLGLLTAMHDQCLPRSLALAHYLAHRGFVPDLVFAVRLGPFRAHCWVECANMLVNDRFERVQHYTPIHRL